MLDNFDDRYLGAKASDPSVDNDGNALVVGALYFNTTDGVMKVYTASGWIAASSASVATLATFEFVATSGQTVFTGADANGATLSYVAPALIVTLNGVRLRPGDDYTATNGTSITLVSAAALNDELVVDAFGSFLVANTYTIAQVDALLANEVSQTSSTGAANLPSGTTAQRPGSPVNGQARYNSTINQFEVYQNGSWTQYNVTYPIEYLVIAGGGGGGTGTNGPNTEGGGGGGAGGYRCSVAGESSGGGSSAESSLSVTSSIQYTVTVGAGGAAGGIGTNGSQGGSSSFSSITSVGGGYGAGNSQNGGSGGSGGGAGSQGTRSGGSATSGQGYVGGAGSDGAQSGGGGGAGAAGVNSGTYVTAGNGGNGVSSSITGSAVTRAGGGGGGSFNRGLGGSGGGGNGAGVGTGNDSVAGTANTGGGGGGGGQTGGGTRAASAGGSGVVIIRYLGAQRGTGGTVTSSGGYTIHTFTSSGTYTA